MDRFFDIASTIAFAFAAINVMLAMYFYYRYTVGRSSTTNFRNAQFNWIISGVFVVIAALTDNSLSTTTSVVIAVGALLAPAVPVMYLRRIRTERTPTFLDQIAMDDVIDRARNCDTRD